MKIHFGHRVGKIRPLVLNYPVTFVPLQLGVVLVFLKECIYIFFGFIFD